MKTRIETEALQPHIIITPAIGADSKLEVLETMDEISDLPVEDAILTTAPEVPPAITRDHPALVKVPLVTTTKLAQLTSQYKYEQWTFNGTVPGAFIRARVGDVVELTLTNKEYYVMQSEFYHEPPEVDDDGRRSEIVEFSYPNGLREEPQVVAFNGSESALSRDHPLKANVGDDVRTLFGNAAPNLTSPFHVIDSDFKNVYRDGDVISLPASAVQTVSVPSGRSTIVDLKMAVPGTYPRVRTRRRLYLPVG